MGSSSRIKIPHAKYKVGAFDSEPFIYRHWRISCLIAAAILWAARYLGRDIINYPDKEIIYYPALVLLPVSLWLVGSSLKKDLRDFYNEPLYAKVIAGLLLLLASVVMALIFVLGTVYLGFNIYDTAYSKHNDINRVECDIESSNPGRHPNVYYKLNGKGAYFNCRGPILYEMKENHNCTDYKLVLNMRKGVMGTYVVENWDIVHK